MLKLLLLTGNARNRALRMQGSSNRCFRILLLLIACSSFGLLQHVQAQTTYQISGPTPGNLLRTSTDATTSGATEILAYNFGGGASANVWSTSQALPFAFDFYGTPVSHYIVTKNGLLSFDTTATGTATATALDVNTALPNTNLPNNTIAFFWGDFAPPLGSNDDVWSITYGTAPNRQHWVFNYSFKLDAISFTYNAVVFEETTNKIYFVDMYNGAEGGTFTVGLQKDATTSIQLGGSPNVALLNTGSGNTDNDYYEFSPRAVVATDAAAVGLVNPVAGVCYSAAQPVEVTIKNFGSSPLTNIPVAARITGGATPQTITSTFTGTLAPNTTANVVVGNANMSAAGTYSITAYTALTTDLFTGNDTLKPVPAFVVTPTVALPQVVDFTGFTGSNLNTVFPNWVEMSGTPPSPTGTTSNWTSDDFANTTTHLNGTAARITLDGATDEVWIVGPKVTATATTALKFDLALTASGATTAGTLGSDDQLRVMISTNCGNTFTPIRTYDATSTISNTGQIESVSLAAYAGQDIIIAFYATEGTVNDPESNDLFIDDLFIGTPPAVDLAALELVSPAEGSCFTGPEPVIVTIQNLGLNTLDFSTTPVTITLNVTGAVTQNPTFTLNTGTLAPNATLNANVGTFSMTTSGTYTFNGNVSIAGDGLASNNSFPAKSVLNATIATFPALQDFENFTPNGSDAPGKEGWTGTTTGMTWEVEEGTSGSTGTGPAVDHTLGTTSGNYVFLETSDGAQNDVAELITPCINLTGQTGMGMEFWYHMFGATIDTLRIDVHNGTTWVNDLLVLGGQKQSATTAPWLRARVNLSAFNGNVIKVRFRGKRGSSFTGDIAIDDVRFYQLPPVDLAVTNVTLPNSSCGLTTTETVCITIANNGSTAVSNFPVSYNVNAGPAVTETVTASIAPGATLQYCFVAKANLSTAGTYSVSGAVNAATDADTTNNTATGSVTSVPTIATYPYFQDFENGNGGWRASGTNSSWALGTPAGSVIIGAASGTNAWVTNLAGDHPNQEMSAVVGPCFDFTNLTNPSISMKIWWDIEEDWDGAVLQSSIDGGASWQLVGAYGDPNNWYNYDSINANPGNQPASLNGNFVGWSGTGLTGSGGWVTASHALTGLGGQSSVQLRIAFASDAAVVEEGFAFDDVTITNMVAVPTVTLSGPATFCDGDSVILAATSATTGATFQWFESGTAIAGATNDSLTVTASGIYTVVATAGGSATSAPDTITVNPKPATPTITTGGPAGQELTSSAATGNQWLLNGQPISGATDQVYQSTANGAYAVIVTDANGCTSDTSAVVNITNTGIKGNFDGMSVSVYPNPSKGNFNVKLTGYKQEAALELYSLTGQLIVKENVKAGKEVTSMQVKNLAAGTYMLKVISEKGVQVSKLIVE